MAGDEVEIDAEGLRVGDWHLRVVPAGATSDDLDNEQNRERARRAEDDARAQRGGEASGEPGRADAQAELEASIEAAREQATEGDDVPLLLRDPLTGVVVPLR